MKGLITKDIYVTVSAFRSFFVFLLVFFAVGVAVPGTAFYVPYLAAIPGSLASSMIALEERENWNSFAGTLPVSRRELVSAKYLFAVFMVAAGALLATLVNVVQALRTGAAMNVIPVFVQCFALGLVLPTVNLPINYVFGTVKTRYVSMFLIIIMIVLAMNNSDSQAGNVIAVFDTVPFWAICLGLAVLFAASWLFSCWFVERKDID